MDLRSVIPHREPMLLVDRIDELVPGTRGRGSKLVTAGGMSSSLVIDALGQVAIAVLAESGTPRVWYLASLESMELGAPARPGELLSLEASVERLWKTTARIHLRASVPNGHDVVKGTMVLSNASEPRAHAPR
jgi:3-hydroxyacyl-[acyl-carrier-protein] dehydratase